MKKTIFLAVSVGALVCSAAVALGGQAGAPTQRAHIPGIANGTNLYPTSPDRGKDFIAIGCVSKDSKGAFQITDWRGAATTSIAGAPTMAATPQLTIRLDGDHDMLNFQVGHEVQITGLITDPPTLTEAAKMKVDSVLYLSRSCWTRGTNDPLPESQQPKR
jgi:hypothetical protein